MFLYNSPSAYTANEDIIVESLRHPAFQRAGVDVVIARLDQIDSVVSGNKWFKLKYNIEEAVSMNATGLLTFGGAYSNHLHAVAAIGNRLGLATVGILRGELHASPTPTLSDCLAWGMRLCPVTRAQYKSRNDKEYKQQLLSDNPGYYLVPEGGSNGLAVRGVSELVVSLLRRQRELSLLACPVGSGGTLAGCIEGVRAYVSECLGGQKSKPCQVLGFSALKGAKETLKGSVNKLLLSSSGIEWDICEDYHFGGFGKCPSELIDFMNSFELESNVPLDPVYTAKMAYGLVDQVQQGRYAAGSRLLVLHTGGLQGRRGYL